MIIKDYEFKDDFIPCGLAMRMAKILKRESDFNLKICEAIYIKDGDLSQDDFMIATNEMLSSKEGLFEERYQIFIDIVYEYINFYYPIEKDVICRTFSDSELMDAYSKIKSIGAEKTEGKKKD